MKPKGISVELKSGSRLSLHITLEPNIRQTLRVPLNELPWGTHDSMVIVAARRGGRCLRTIRPIEDPPFDKISVEPNTPLTGNIDLESLFPDIRDVLKESDVQLFWAYEAPEALHIPSWAGGWILIPKQQ
jgi:hypothetical protein